MDTVALTIGSAGGLAGTFLGPLAMLFGMIGLMVISVVLFMRSALLYLVAAFAPIVWASAVSPVMRGSGRRLVHVTVALVLAKPAITISLVVGTKLMSSAGTPGLDGAAVDGAAALGTLVTGFACFAIGGLSPWVVYRLLPSVEQASVSSGIVSGWGRTGMTAVQAGLMAKSLGASAAGSAATRAVSQGGSLGGGAVGGGAVGGGASSMTSGGAGAMTAGHGPATAALHRPPIPPDTTSPRRAPTPTAPSRQREREMEEQP
jgi:hypothetical protein